MNRDIIQSTKQIKPLKEKKNTVNKTGLKIKQIIEGK